MSDITTLLCRANAGERDAFDALVAQLYPELRRIAHARLARHAPATVIQTTMVVHECYLKLLAMERLTPRDRVHFLAYAAHVMRSIIVDALRAAGRERRGGDVVHVTLSNAVDEQAAASVDEIRDVDAALVHLGKLDPRLVRVVEMRYFAGMSEKDIADALGVTDRTVRRDWEKARLLLAAALK